MESEWHWQPVDRSFSLPIIPAGGIKELTSKFDLCVTGEVANIILNAFVYNAVSKSVLFFFASLNIIILGYSFTRKYFLWFE